MEPALSPPSSSNGICPHQQALLPPKPPSFNPPKTHPWETPLLGSGIPGATRDRQCSRGRGDDSCAKSLLDPQPTGPGCPADAEMQAASPASLCPPQALNRKAKLSQPTQGRAKIWHPLTAPQCSIKGARSRETGGAEHSPKVVHGERESERGGAGHQWGIWAEWVPSNVGQE